jgi:hypothetical protein
LNKTTEHLDIEMLDGGAFVTVRTDIDELRLNFGTVEYFLMNERQWARPLVKHPSQYSVPELQALLYTARKESA